eukprot:scaffold191528_cov14-Tisochrysis_lutea.AAC.1
MHARTRIGFRWVHAMNSYDRVAKVVAPKREKLKEAEASYRKVSPCVHSDSCDKVSLCACLAICIAAFRAAPSNLSFSH